MAVAPGTSVGAVLRCSFGWWYPRLRGVALKAESVRVPSALVEWLRSDGVALGAGVLGAPGSDSGDEDVPRGLGARWTGEDRGVGPSPEVGAASAGARAESGALAGGREKDEVGGDEDDEDEDNDDDSGWGDAAGPVAPDFPGLARWMEGAIARLGGAVMPKLSWTSPKDATWVSPYGSLMCTNPGEVFLLLKCSESVLHDVEHAFANCVDAVDGGPRMVGRGEDEEYPEEGGEDDGRGEPEEVAEGEGNRGAVALRLVLKKWQPGLLPSNEFRCFVRCGELVAVCQRDVTVFYEHLVEEKDRYGDALAAWHDEHVADAMEDEDYVLDVYVTKACRCYLMDVNPYGGETLPLLFTWDEIDALARGESLPDSPQGGGAASLAEGRPNSPTAPPGIGPGAVYVRVVEESADIRPTLRMGVPHDLVDTSDTSALAEFLAAHIQRQEVFNSPAGDLGGAPRAGA